MKRIEIKASDFDYLVEKEDVNLVVLKDGRTWVCQKNRALEDLGNGFYRLTLARRSDK